MPIEKTINLKVNTAEAVTGLKKVRAEIDITYAELRRTTPIELDGAKAKAELKDVSKSIKSTAKDSKTIGKGAKEAIKDFKDLGEQTDVAKGFFDKLKISTQGFGLALKATGIGLIVAALVKMKEALGKNQVVMDTVNVVMETINITLQKFINNIVKAFTNPQETLKKFGDTIQTYVVDYVKGAIESIGLFGEAIGKVFKGEFKEAAEIAKDGVKTLWNTNPIVRANKAVMDYNKSVKDTVVENTKSAKSLVELRKEVKLAEAQQRLLQLTYQKDAELQRQIRDDVSKTFDERIDANRELGRILDEQFAEEKKLADKKLELAEAELAKNKENVDLQVAVTNAKTELADLEERITGQRSEQLVNLTALQSEYNDYTREFGTLQHKNLEATKDFQAEIDKWMKDNRTTVKENDDEDDKEQESALDKKLRRIKGHYNSINKVTSHFFKEGSAAAKASALAQILIDTATGVSGAISAGAMVGPFPVNLAAIASGVSSVMAGIASARKIFAKVPGGGGGGGGESVDISRTPRGMGGNLIPNIEGVTGAISTAPEGTPIQAYVVENDISSSQALQQELEEQATL